MLRRVNIWLWFLLAVPAGLKAQTAPAAVAQQKYYPQYHFRPAAGWIGDPDGLVYTDSLFHLFWWGHATSPDLVHWTEHPQPMKGGDGTFSYFSGSVAVDNHNTAGFGRKSMVAVFTRHYPGDTLPETQALAVSTDGGTVFNYYAQNPVLDINRIFFRDPQVFWYAPGKLWKMVVSVPDIQQIHIYESADLKSWKFCSAFDGLGAKNSFWECPDLFELSVAGTGQKKWVMLIGRGPNRVQYFVGDFNGKTFTPDSLTAAYLTSGTGLSGTVFEDFEQGLGNWKPTGNFAGKEPPAVDYLGNSYVATPAQKPSAGRLTSQTFNIQSNAINFLIAGSNKPGSTCINLVVDGKTLRSTTGDNTKFLNGTAGTFVV